MYKFYIIDFSTICLYVLSCIDYFPSTALSVPCCDIVFYKKKYVSSSFHFMGQSS